MPNRLSSLERIAYRAVYGCWNPARNSPRAKLAALQYGWTIPTAPFSEAP